jgi:uncharacterized protein (TIGR03067 family)
MNRSAVTLLILAVSLPAFAGDDAVKQEREKFQGTWVLESSQFVTGKNPGKDLFKGVRVVVNGEIWTLSEGGKEIAKQKWTIDPTKDPKHLDLHFKRGEKEVVAKCLYKLDGDTLTILHPIGDRVEDIARARRMPTADATYVFEVWKRRKN